MIRMLCYRTCPNWILQDVYKNFAEKSEYIKYINNVRTSKLYSSCYCSAYFLNDENRNQHERTMYSLYKIGCQPFHTNNMNLTMMKTSAFDFNKASTNFFNIRMEDLKLVPTSAFWIGMGGLVPFWFPFMSSFIIGYSHFFSSAQYLYAATLLSCMGGIKWGYLVNHKDQWSWENFGLSIVPCMLAFFALVVPKLVGYLVLMAGFLIAFLIDLTTSNYPKWFITLRGVLTNISVFFLFLSMLQKLFH